MSDSPPEASPAPSRAPLSVHEQAELLELTRDAIMVREVGTGVIRYWNHGAEEMYGWPRAEAVGNVAHELLHTQFPVPLDEIRATLVESGQWEGELVQTARDGRRVVVMSRWAVQVDEQGRATGHLQINTDVTRQKSAERLYRELLESAPDAMVITDRDGRIRLVNGQTERMFGYDRSELIGQPVETLIPPRYRGHHVGLRETYQAHPQTRPMGAGLELFAVRKNGTEFPVEVSLSPVPTDSTTLVASVVRDVTDRRRMLDQLREQAHALEQQARDLARSNAELEQFAYVASHDLQEPLRMVASYTQLLARRYRGKLDEDADEFIHFAVDGAVRMQELINDLLAYSRVGTRGRPFEPTDCNAVVDQVLADLAPAIEDSGATIERGDLPTISADPSQIHQLFQNLIGNAMKFRGERAPVVRVSAKRQDSMWRFSVADNGIGIEPQYQDRIFVLFQRLHSRGEYPGTGIGLAICKRIVERHGGKIWVESVPGESTTFLFTLPAEQKEEA